MSERKTIIKNLLLQAVQNELKETSNDEIDLFLHICRIGCQEEAPKKAVNIFRICHAVARQYNLYPVMRNANGGPNQYGKCPSLPFRTCSTSCVGWSALKNGFNQF